MPAGNGTDGVAGVTYYMVFGSVKRHTFSGKWISWEPQPLGVYAAESPAEACKVAASEMDKFGTFFAIEGVPWGIELQTANAQRFGSEPSVEQRLMERLNRMDDLDRREAELRARIAQQSGDEE